MRLINRHPGRTGSLMLLLLPFIVLIAVYFTGSSLRLQANPDDKLLPSATQMKDALHEYAFSEDKRTGEYMMWDDTVSSMKRLGIGLAASAAIALVFGIVTGSIPLAGTTLSPFITVISMIPPLAVLPILFIVFGLDELSKVVLIVIGITPMMIRDLQQRTREIPEELWIKAQTLGASSWTLILRVIVPQLLPRLLIALRLALTSAWLFLIAAGSDRLDGWPRLSHLSRAPLSRDGCDPAVRRVDHAARVVDRRSAAPSHAVGVPWYNGGRA